MDHAFTVETAVQGFHVYQCFWDAANDGEILHCEKEVGNSDDPSAVAIKKGATTDVGTGQRPFNFHTHSP